MKIQGLKVHVAHSDVDMSNSSFDSDVLKQAKSVSEAIAEIGGKPYVSNYSNAMKKLTAHKDRPDMVFNLVTSVKGNAQEKYRAAMFFQNSYYPYTGAAYKALQNLKDTSVEKQLFAESGVSKEIAERSFPESFSGGREVKVALIEVDKVPVVLAGAESGNKQAEELALKCWEAFKLSGYAEVSVALDDDGGAYVLSVDASPSLLPEGTFASACASGGYSYNQVIENILKAGMRAK